MIILSSSKPKAKKDHKCNFCFDTILKGNIYDNQTNICDGALYTWKTHIRCSNIASDLEMYDDCDEGVNGDDFCDAIKEEYRQLQIKIDRNHYESKDFKYPPFKDQLDFVCNNHLTVLKKQKCGGVLKIK